MNGYPNVLQQGYKTLADACLAWEHAVAAGTVGDPTAFPVLPATPVRPPPTSPTTLACGGWEGIKQPPSMKVWQSSCPTTPTKPSPLSPQVADALLASPHHPCLPTVQEPAERMLHKAMPIISYLSEPICPLSDEEVYWVVMEGDQPGVYLSK
jgi:hypothetical protein